MSPGRTRGLWQRFPPPVVHRRARVHEHTDEGSAEHADQAPDDQKPRPDWHDTPFVDGKESFRTNIRASSKVLISASATSPDTLTP
jgi:hypothetical protein